MFNLTDPLGTPAKKSIGPKESRLRSAIQPLMYAFTPLSPFSPPFAPATHQQHTDIKQIPTVLQTSAYTPLYQILMIDLPAPPTKCPGYSLSKMYQRVISHFLISLPCYKLHERKALSDCHVAST